MLIKGVKVFSSIKATKLVKQELSENLTVFKKYLLLKNPFPEKAAIRKQQFLLSKSTLSE